MTTQAMNNAPAPAPALKPKRTLAAIIDDYINELNASEGEVTLELDELDGEIDEKALAYQYAAKKIKAAIKGQEAQADYFKKQAKKHADRADSLNRGYERMRERLAEGMRVSRKTEIPTVVGKIYFQDFPTVRLPPDWAREAYEARDDYQRYVNKKVVFEPKKTVMLDDFKKHLADFRTALPEDQAWAAAIEQMPEGFSVDRNTKLCGL